ncbi:hypothetical protein AF335_06170 [Streptomyces eurocidicus]|uniref:Chromosome segregation ATPase n=1 Tax=Streptomyces eurocidicus TaxID=66423 RepID=A0A2N8NZM5_STREU|nr:hypothetical protein [Streptomyces eurocidicus]MBB5118712.1 chromosome segregation ATPase [Streptomyces eurocidicus]MBF6051473.1 hypothetical protein [Streptomyces eurocidicus]PNE34228.1 hypothetical protein AF335_06170 [Streptomyces eurocidicus]
MTGRIHRDHLTDHDLNQLYNRLETAEAALARIETACAELHRRSARRFDDTSNGIADVRRRILSELNTSAAL